MSFAGIVASWLALGLAAFGFTLSLAAVPARPALRDSAIRALWLSAFAAASAAGILIAMLVTGQFDVAFVAAHITQNLPSQLRIAALLSVSAGAVLPTASLVAVVGAWRAARSSMTLGAAVSGATVVALLASSIAATPFVMLGWHPAEGLGLPPSMQEWPSIGARVALMLAIVSASTVAAHAADRVAAGAHQTVSQGFESRLTTTIALLTIAIVADAAGALAAGTTWSSGPIAGMAAMLVPAVLNGALTWRTRNASALAALLGGVGLLGSCVAALLASGAAAIPVPLRLLFGAAAVASALGALLVVERSSPSCNRFADTSARALLALSAVPLLLRQTFLAALSTSVFPAILLASLIATIASQRRYSSSSVRPLALQAAAMTGGALAALVILKGLKPPVLWSALACGTLAHVLVTEVERGVLRPTSRLLLTLSLVAAFVAAAGEGLATTRTLTLAAGERARVAGRLGANIQISHQGVSRFERTDAHVVALGLEVTDGASTRLTTAEQRDYVDSRQSPLATGVLRPGIVNTTFAQFRFRLDSVAPNDTVTLTATTTPFVLAWTASAMIAIVAALVSWLARPLAARLNTGERHTAIAAK
ncbi:MAG: hypothetical protein ABIT38_03525 [Gemmatimonadaceae bacterium]